MIYIRKSTQPSSTKELPKDMVQSHRLLQHNRNLLYKDITFLTTGFTDTPIQ